MKFLILIAIVLGSVVTLSTEAAPQSYPLVCRGGAGTLGYGAGAALYYFRKAPASVGHGLNPGECSWVDRPIGAGEPPCLRQTGVQANAWIFPDQLQSSYFTSQNAPWLRTLLKSHAYQTFQVYNPGQGCFVVTRLGP